LIQIKEPQCSSYNLLVSCPQSRLAEAIGRRVATGSASAIGRRFISSDHLLFGPFAKFARVRVNGRALGLLGWREKRKAETT